MKLLFFVYLFSMTQSLVFADLVDGLWIKRFEHKIAVAPADVELVIDWQDSLLESFCQRSKEYLSMHMSSYEQYDCDNITVFNEGLCKTIKKEFVRQNEHSGPFGLDLQADQVFYLSQKNKTNWNLVQSRLSKKYLVAPSDVVIFENWEKFIVDSWDLVDTDNKFFSKIVRIMSTPHETEVQGLQTRLGGIIQNRFLACAILKKEKEFAPNKRLAVDKMQVGMKKDLLDSLWTIFNLVQNEWNNLTIKNVYKFHQNSHLLLNIGVVLKDIEKRHSHLPKSYHSMEHWFDRFFNFKIENDELHVSFKENKNINDFEKNIYPANIYDYEYATTLVLSQE